MDPVSLLLACPRGRRFCANVAGVADAAAEFALNPHTDADPVRALADLDATVVTGLSEFDLLAALGLAVDIARYWQRPDDEDLLYARSDVVQALRPVAEAALASPRAAWWGEPPDREHQRLTSYFNRDEGWTDWPLHHRHDDRDLLQWREHVLANESRFHEHYAASPDRKLSGEWWSTPEPSLTWSTTRARAGLGLGVAPRGGFVRSRPGLCVADPHRR